ncbi:MAG: T9SS type A sorting domain-containing protein, partial [Spirochaetes bacterium]|nr:T9SS type A sorting domain-containing protein [Spirochaetota bacterium]
VDNLFRASDNSIYGSSGSGILRSSDGGSSFQVISAESSGGLFEDNDGIFYRTSNSNVEKSFNKGYTWKRTSSLMKGLTNYGLYINKALLKANDGKLYVGTAIDDNDGYVFKSGYAYSSEVFLDFKPEIVLSYQGITKSEVLCGGSITYEFSYSQDSGVTWSDWAQLSDAALQAVNCLGNGKEILKVKATFNTVNRHSTPVINNVILQYNDGSEINLDQAVIGPNPFEPRSDNDKIIFYNLPSVIDKIKVFSSGGGVVAEFNNIITSGGRYTWNVKKSNGEPIKSGVYICYIKDGNGNEKKLKFVVIR